MAVKRKAVNAAVKAVGEDGAGEFEAIVSVFGNVDSYGDVVMPGAFEDTLKAYAEAGKSIPVVFAHGAHDVGNFIGKVTEARETDEGLYVKGVLYMDMDRAKQVHRLFKDGVLGQFSFAYGVEKWAAAKRGDRDVIELLKLDLYEVGPCLVGANQSTRLVGVKAADDGDADAVAELRELVEALRGIAGDMADVLADNDNDEGEGGGDGDEADPNADDTKTPATGPDAGEVLALEAAALRAAL